MQNPLFIKQACMHISPEFDLMSFGSDNCLVRRINGCLLHNEFEYGPNEIKPVSESVSKAFDIYMKSVPEYSRVTFCAHWNPIANHSVVQVHGVNGKESKLLFASRINKAPTNAEAQK